MGSPKWPAWDADKCGLCFDRIVRGRRLLFADLGALRARSAWRRVATFSSVDKGQVVSSQCDDFSSPLICARFSELRVAPRERGHRVGSSSKARVERRRRLRQVAKKKAHLL